MTEKSQGIDICNGKYTIRVENDGSFTTQLNQKSASFVSFPDSRTLLIDLIQEILDLRERLDAIAKTSLRSVL